MSRGKIQFTETDGDEFWVLYEQVSALRQKRSQRSAQLVRKTYPDLEIFAPNRPIAAGPLTLALFREELERLQEDERHVLAGEITP
jgi:hypothetical protein